MKTRGPLWCGGGPMRQASARAGEAAMANVVASIVRRLTWFLRSIAILLNFQESHYTASHNLIGSPVRLEECMSLVGTERTYRGRLAMSAFGGKADIRHQRGAQSRPFWEPRDRTASGAGTSGRPSGTLPVQPARNML